jgi:hypothetical protein
MNLDKKDKIGLPEKGKTIALQLVSAAQSW